MTIIGLTGPTGAGKGSFAAYLPFPVLDTDRVAREVVEPHKPCLAELVEEFGERILSEDGTLNRKLLGSIAFADKTSLAALNRITHRHITQRVHEWLDTMRARGEIAVVIDAPQLFESGEDALCDVTVAVLGNVESRLARIMTRDGISEEYARTRMRAQKSDEFFRARCTVCVENNGTPDELAAEAARFASAIVDGKYGKAH